MRIFRNSYVRNQQYVYCNYHLEDSKKYPAYFESFGWNVLDDRSFCHREKCFFYVVLYTVDGEGVFRYQGEEYAVGAGDFLFFDAYQCHEYEPKKGCEWNFYWMIVGGGVTEAIYQLLFGESFHSISLAEDQQEQALQIWTDLIRCIHDGKDTDIRISSLLSSCLHQVAAWDLPRKKDLFQQKIDRFIDRHLHGKIHVEELADYVHVSSKTLLRYFQKYQHMSTSRYIESRRLDHAKIRLIQTDESLEEIAEKVGISNCGRFIRSFREKFHMTPREYRLRYLSESVHK